MEFIKKALKVKLTFTEEVLGLSPASKEVYRVGDRIEVINPDGTLCQKGDTGTIVSKERK